MTVPIKIRANVRTDMKAAMPVLAATLRPEMAGLGMTLQGEVRRRMRYDRGKERENVKAQVRRNGFGLSVFGNLIQTIIDEFGRLAGKAMPPWKQGTRLFGWVGRHIVIDREGVRRTRRLAFASDVATRRRFVGSSVLRTKRQTLVAKQESIAFLVARSIAKRGIAPGRPFERTFLTFRPFIVKRIETAIGAAVAKINTGI